MRREKTPVSVAAGARRAGVSRTSIYTNPDAKTTVSRAIRETADQRRTVLAEADDAREAAWRERALNGEDALKAAHIEIPHWRLLGRIRDREAEWTAGISPDTNDGTPASGAAVVEDNLRSEVEHPDAWAHRNLDELDRAYATAVREMSTGAGGAANEKGAPALGCPLVWVCGYRCGTLTFGWMSMTHAWWPTSVGMLIAEATLIGVLTAVAAWAGAARPRMAAASPLATTAANPNLFIVVPSSFYLLLCSSRGANVAVRALYGPVMMVPVRRSSVYNTQFRALIPVAVFDRWLAATGQRPRAGALNWTPMSDPGHAAGGGRTWQTHRRSSMRAPPAPHLVSWCPARPAGDGQQPCQRVESFGRAAAVWAESRSTQASSCGSRAPSRGAGFLAALRAAR